MMILTDNKSVVIILMVRKCLSFMLVALIALQSVATIADSHERHQTGIEHLEFEHDHDSKPDDNKQITEKSQNTPSDTQFDCHHCCHCHGMTHLFLGGGNGNVYISFFGQKVSESPFPYLSYLISPDLRPPIV